MRNSKENVSVEFNFTVKTTRHGEVVEKVEMSGSLSATNVRETFEQAARGFKEGFLHDEPRKKRKKCNCNDGFEPVM